ncbi:MAG: DUF4282 domain-containing protein [Bacteroidota bacterium]
MEQTNITQHVPLNQGFNWKDFLSFRTMITLQIIQILYVVGAIVITLGSLAMMFGGGRHSEYGGGYGGGFGGGSPFSLLGGGGFIAGLIFLLIGNIGWRIWCELIIVFFRINKTLTNIETNTKM